MLTLSLLSTYIAAALDCHLKQHDDISALHGLDADVRSAQCASRPGAAEYPGPCNIPAGMRQALCLLLTCITSTALAWLVTGASVLKHCMLLTLAQGSRRVKKASDAYPSTGTG